MPVAAEIQVYGVRDSLKILGEIDRKQRLAAVAKIKGASRELVTVAKETYPTEAPLSGMKYPGFFQYDPTKVQRALKVRVGGRARFGSAPLVTLVQDNPGANLYDLAGLRNNAFASRQRRDRSGGRRYSITNNRTFTPNLTAKWGPAVRGMGRSINLIRRTGYQAILDALEDVAAEANRRLVR